DGAWVPPGARQATNARETPDIVDHLAQDRESVVADVEGSAARRRVGDYALERQIRVGIEIQFEPGHEVPEVEPGRAPGPRHEPLLDEDRGLCRARLQGPHARA